MAIKIWDVKSGDCIKTLTGHEAKVLYVKFSPDGNYIASGAEDFMAKLWDVNTGQCIETYADHEYFVWAVCFSPDYKYLATSSGDKTIKFRELKRRGTEIFITSETKSELSMNIPKTGKTNSDAIAVVIGNKNYKKDVPPVEFAFTDASVTKDYLVNTLGYKEENIIFLKDATQSDLISAFGSDNDHKGRLYDLVKPGKSDVFVYYSGHGAPDPQTKSAFIVPVDCEPNKVTLNGFSLATFYKNLGKLEYKSLTVVIDACFSGGSDAGMIIQNASPIFITTSEESTDMNTKKNSVIFTSSKGEQISSWYRDKGHSLFSYYFLLALGGEGDADKDGKLTAKEISKFVDENVPSQARKLYSRDQNPQINGDRDMIIVEY
jgi:WD40 repeat protein